MKGNLMKYLGMIATVIGAGATVLGAYADRKNTEEYIDKKVLEEVDRKEAERMNYIEG